MRRLKTAEVKFMRCTAGYSSLDHRKNEDILEELKVGSVEKKLAQYNQKWLSYVSRMEDNMFLYNLLTISQTEEEEENLEDHNRLLDGEYREG
jgi:hypothetical protein